MNNKNISGLLLIIIPLLIACSSTSPLSQSETKPTVTAPAPTTESTKAPTPEPTKVPFAELMPEKWMDCKVNDLNPNDRTIVGAYANLEKLLALEQKLNINPNDVSERNNAQQIFGYSGLVKAPEVLGILVNVKDQSNFKARIGSCSYMKIGEDEFYIFGVPFRMFPKENSKITFLHFALNIKAAERKYESWESYNFDIGTNFFEKFVNPEKNYSKIYNSSFNKLYFSIIVGISSPEPLAHYWKTSMQLFNKVKDDNFFQLWNSNSGLVSKEIQKIILPCTDIRIDPIYPQQHKKIFTPTPISKDNM